MGKSDEQEKKERNKEDAAHVAAEGVPVSSPFKDDTGDEAEDWEEKGEEVDAPAVSGDELAEVFLDALEMG